MKHRLLLLSLAALLLLSSVSAEQETPLYVERIDLPPGFILGMDVSSVLALEQSGVRYFDASGQEKDLFQILAENSLNWIRVRVWNDPFDDQGRSYGGGNNDVAAAAEIGRRAAAHGLRLLVDFH